MSDDEGLDYASSGVDIELEGASIASLIGTLGASTRPSGTVGAPVDLPGGFGGLVEFGDNLLALATDGVGSKLQLASALGEYGGVGIDCMAMNVNDLICVGAEPIAFVDYIATPEPDPVVHAALGESLAEACRIARVTLAGGETASLPGIVKELDLSGTALGWLPKGEAVTGETIQADDVLIGLPSNGIHSNGYSLVRRLLELTGADLTEPAPFDATHAHRDITRFASSAPDSPPSLGEVLLNPTRIYVSPVVDLLLACRAGAGPCAQEDIHGIGHITGGGLSNLLRLNSEVGWHIHDPLPVPPEFEWIQSEGNVDSREMARTFNLGMGMALAVDSAAADAVTDWLASRLPGSRVVGRATSDSHRVTHADEHIVFDTY